MEPGLKLSASDRDPMADPLLYRRMIGRLMYLTISRPDVNFVVCKLSQYMSNPRVPHQQAQHQLLRYIKSALGQCLFFSVTSPLSLKAFADADWGRCLDSRRSTYEFIVFLGDPLLSSTTKMQPTISKSSAEAEYRALSVVLSELTWLVALLKEFQVDTGLAMVFCDNQAAIHLLSNPTFHKRSKNIEIDCHFIRENVNSGIIKLVHVKTQHQLVVLLTKPLPFARFQLLLSKLGVLDLYLPT